MAEIWFGELRVGTVSSSSGIFAGSNKLAKYSHTSKQNQAFGTVNGQQCSIMGIVNVLDDLDEADMEWHGKKTIR